MRSLREIKLFLLDMDGTIYLGDNLFPCTRPFLDELNKHGIDFLFLTNNSSRSKKEYQVKLKRLGIDAALKNLITSGDVTIDFIKEHYPGQRVYLVGTKALEESFAEEGIRLCPYTDADIVVVGFDLSLSYDKLNGIYQMVRGNKGYICTHPDLVCPTEDGYIPDIGATIAYIEALTGRKPDHIIGKPQSYMIKAAAKRFNRPKDVIAMVGDRLYTDIKMAVDASITSVLVLSGETSEDDLAGSATVPDYVFEDLSGITEMLR